MRLFMLSVLAALVLAPAAGAWSWPAGGDVLRTFDFDRNHPYVGGQHRGIDIAGDPGSAVIAPAGGSVSFAGTVPTGGKTVTIQTADGYAVTLVHLGSYTVARGASVAEGDTVGTIGPSGVSDETRPFVYLGIRLADDPQGYVDPLTILPPREVSVGGGDGGSGGDPADELTVTAPGADGSTSDTPGDPAGANAHAGSTGSEASEPAQDERADTPSDPAGPDTVAGDEQAGSGDAVEPESEPASEPAFEPAPEEHADTPSDPAGPGTLAGGEQAGSGDAVEPVSEPASEPAPEEHADTPSDPVVLVGTGDGVPADPPGGWHVGWPETGDPTHPGAASPATNGEPPAQVSADPVPGPEATGSIEAVPPQPETSFSASPPASVGRPARVETPGAHVRYLGPPVTIPAAAPAVRHARVVQPAIPGPVPDRAPAHAAPRATRQNSVRAARADVRIRRSGAPLPPTGGGASPGGNGRLELAVALALLALAAGTAGTTLGRRRRRPPTPPGSPSSAAPSGPEPPRIIVEPSPSPDPEAHLAARNTAAHPRRRRLAVRGRAAAHRPRRRVRPLGRVRAVSPATRQQRAHGLGHRRARHARDGDRRPGRALAA